MPSFKLQSPGWSERTRQTLETLIRRGAGKQLPVVFDFDNTLIHADVGEATLAILARDGLLLPDRISRTLSPPFHALAKGDFRLESCADVIEYYEAFLAPTAHGERDPTPLANGYAWVVEIMEGLSPLTVLQATRTACAMAVPGKSSLIEVTPGKTAFPAPYFQPEMVELIRLLLEQDFDLWIVSASNVWSVRWMVRELLHPLLRQSGLRRGLRMDHIVGISTLLTDRNGQLHKDALLVRERPDYAALDPAALDEFRLTSRLQFPVPTYSGKVACLFDLIGQKPYLCAGDAPGDFSMLALSQHRLWLARLEKPGYQKATLALIRKTGPGGWLIQPTISGPTPGLVPSADALVQRLKPLPPKVRESRRLLSHWFNSEPDTPACPTVALKRSRKALRDFL